MTPRRMLEQEPDLEFGPETDARFRAIARKVLNAPPLKKAGKKRAAPSKRRPQLVTRKIRNKTSGGRGVSRASPGRAV